MLSLLLTAAIMVSMVIVGAPTTLADDANAIYVAKNGTSAGPGTITAPYLTVAQGITALQPGGTLYIREGNYAEAVTIAASKSGSAALGQTVIAAYPGEKPVISGTSGTRISMTGSSHHFTIQGLTLSGGSYGINYSSSNTTGGLENIFFLDNTIYGISGNNSICLYNNNSTEANSLRNVIVRGNHVWGGRSGSTETVVLNGNINGFEVSGNVIHNNNNIGIDLIGYESGVNEANRARNGKVFNNIIYGTTVINNTNSDYWNNWEDVNPRPFGGIYDRCSDGIYVDGGRSIEIYNNMIFDNDIGIEVACERSVNSTTMNTTIVYDVQVHDNIIASTNGWAGLCFGGYDGNLAYTQNCDFYNNIFLGNKIGFGVQKSRNNRIYNNIVMGGELAVEFMPFMETRPANGDPFTVAALPGANDFGANVWFNSDDVDGWDSDIYKLATVAPAQFAKQIIALVSPLVDPDNGDFTSMPGFEDFGTDFAFTEEQQNLYSAYVDAHDELIEARYFLETVKFDFMAARPVGNLNTYLTAQLKAAGFVNSEVLYTTRTALSNATNGMGLNDGTSGGTNDTGSIVTKAIGANNGNINATTLNTVYNGLANGATKEYAYIVQVITRYDDGHANHSYTSEATESDVLTDGYGGVRVVVIKPVLALAAGQAAVVNVRRGGTAQIKYNINFPVSRLTCSSAVPVYATVSIDSAGVLTVAGLQPGISVVKITDSISGISINVPVNVVN